jgi:hypothetical protein
VRINLRTNAIDEEETWEKSIQKSGRVKFLGFGTKLAIALSFWENIKEGRDY